MGEDAQVTSDQGRVIDVPKFFYQSLITGYFAAMYDIPFIDHVEYLNGGGAEGWSPRSLKERILPGGLSGFLSKFSDTLAAFDIASKPKWQLTGTGPTYKEISVEFVLFNENIDALAKNIKFLHSIVPGNMWVQDQMLQRSSSLYDVEIPGRMRWFFCKADISSEFAGKVRYMTDDQIKTIIDRITTNSSISINPEAFRFIPDQYKMTISFTPLLPNNFNTYLFYLGNYADKVEVGEQRLDVSSGILEATAASLKDAQNGV